MPHSYLPTSTLFESLVMPGSPAAHDNVNGPFGGLLVGIFLSGILFGSICVQGYTYALNNRDSKGIRLMVCCLCSTTAVSPNLMPLGTFRMVGTRAGSRQFIYLLKFYRVLEAAHTVLMIISAYEIAITNFNNPSIFLTYPTSLKTTTAFSGALSSTVQVGCVSGQAMKYPAHSLSFFLYTGSMCFLSTGSFLCSVSRLFLHVLPFRSSRRS